MGVGIILHNWNFHIFACLGFAIFSNAISLTGENLACFALDCIRFLDCNLPNLWEAVVVGKWWMGEGKI